MYYGTQTPSTFYPPNPVPGLTNIPKMFQSKRPKWGTTTMYQPQMPEATHFTFSIPGTPIIGKATIKIEWFQTHTPNNPDTGDKVDPELFFKLFSLPKSDIERLLRQHWAQTGKKPKNQD